MATAPLILVHGGAGEIEAERLSECIAGCEAAARAGAGRLDHGALRAVIAAVGELERNPSFNAGYGATLTRDGTVELDAAVMTGDLRFGGVAACPPVESASRLALEILEEGEHCLLAGPAAAEFGAAHGIALLGEEDLIVERVRRRFAAVREAALPAQEDPGTVGAVAVDGEGNFAAATSTGGVLMKRRGRVGDTPLIGAGTYADNEAGGAASATGRGEQILRVMLCRLAVDQISRGASAEQAGHFALDELERRVSGKAGLILIDRRGYFAGNSTASMPWAVAGTQTASGA